MRGASSGVGSAVGVGTNLRPRERTLVSAVDKGCPDRLITVFAEVSVLGVGVVLRRGPWYVGAGMSNVRRGR